MGSSNFVLSAIYTSVVIHYLYIPCFAVPPYKTDAPLIVDPDAVLPRPAAFERLKTVPRRDA